MAKLDFGGVKETVVTRAEFPLKKAQKILEKETIAVIGYGVQGPAQALNLKDNGMNVIVGQRRGGASWKKAVADGWKPGKNLFEIDEAAKRATIIAYLLSDAGQIAAWPTIKKYLSKGKALYFSHGFGVVFKKHTKIIPPKDIDVILVALRDRACLCVVFFLKDEVSTQASPFSKMLQAVQKRESWPWE